MDTRKKYIPTELFEKCVAYHYGRGMYFIVEKKLPGCDYTGARGSGNQLIAVAESPGELADKITEYFARWDKEKLKLDPFPYEHWAREEVKLFL